MTGSPVSPASIVPREDMLFGSDLISIYPIVAGESPETSAICVTDCALRYLERDELQGIVAHEFSHILNGDMRLNFRLLMLIAGVTAYNRLGRGMLGMFGSRSDSSESGNSGGGFRLPRGGRGGLFGRLFL